MTIFPHGRGRGGWGHGSEASGSRKVQIKGKEAIHQSPGVLCTSSLWEREAHGCVCMLYPRSGATCMQDCTDPRESQLCTKGIAP